MSKFLYDNDKADAKPIAIPRVFSKDSRAKNPLPSYIYPQPLPGLSGTNGFLT